MDRKEDPVIVEQLKWITASLHRLEIKVDNLEAFKWKAIGGISAAGFLIGLALEYMSRK